MTVWAWVAIGIGAAIGLALLVGLGIARILGSIATDVSSLLDQEQWSSAPLTRAIEEPANDELPTDDVTAKRADRQKRTSRAKE